MITDPGASIAGGAASSGEGFRLFIEDFGTGCSSLGYLSRLSVRVIQIDHGFTMRMQEAARAAAFAQSTIEPAHKPGITR